MENIYPLTALQKEMPKMKGIAREQIVHITENGHAGFIFASEEVMDAYIARERAQAAWEQHVAEAVQAGIDDIDAGRYYPTVDAGFDAALRMRATRNAANPQGDVGDGDFPQANYA